MNRSVLAPVAVALLLVTAGCLGVATAQTEPAPGSESGAAGPATVTVGATGQASAAPDVATVHASVVAVADTAEGARAAAAEDAESLRAALADAGLPAEAVTTVGYRLGTDYSRDREEPDRFRVDHRFAIEVSDVDDAGRIVDAAVAGGANRVDGVSFGLSDETRRDLRTDAVAAAMADARADAEAVAAAAGVGIDRLASASTGGGGGYLPYYRGFDEAADAGTRIDPGPATVSVSVTVTYEVS